MISTTIKNPLSFTADDSGPNPSGVGVLPYTSFTLSSYLHGFGVYQLNTVNTSHATIPTLVLAPISTPLIARFSLLIFSFTKSSAMRIHHPFSLAIWSPRYGIFRHEHRDGWTRGGSNTSSIQNSIFCVDNMSCVGFLTSREKSITINDRDNRPPDVTYFTRLLILTSAILGHQIPFLCLDFLCAYFTILLLLTLIFRYQDILLITFNYRELRLMQTSMDFRILSWTEWQRLRCGTCFQFEVILFPL